VISTQTAAFSLNTDNVGTNNISPFIAAWLYLLFLLMYCDFPVAVLLHNKTRGITGSTIFGADFKRNVVNTELPDSPSFLLCISGAGVFPWPVMHL